MSDKVIPIAPEPSPSDSIRISPNIRKLRAPPMLRSNSPSLPGNAKNVIQSESTSLLSNVPGNIGSSSRSTVGNSSISELTNSNFFDKKILWADSTYWLKITQAEKLEAEFINEAADKRVSKYTLQLPPEIQNEYIDDTFLKNLWLIRAVHATILITVLYGIVRGLSRGIPTWMLVYRIGYFGLLLFIVALSFRWRTMYQKYYHMVTLVGVAFYVPTVAIEFYDTNLTFVIFFIVLVFCGLWATGALLFLPVLVTNLVSIFIMLIFLFAVGKESNGMNVVFFIYLMLVLVLGGSFLYVLEKSRKQNFVFRNRLEKQSEKLLQEKTKSERLLLNILPNSVAKDLKKKKQLGTVISEKKPDVTIMICDIAGFTEISSKTSPKEIVSLLNELFSAFDELCSKYDVEKIKTIGDAYVAVGGLHSTFSEANHAESVVEMALEMLTLPVLYHNCLGAKLKIRIGIASGPVIAGVIGIHKWCYDVYGNTVTEAEDMEIHGSEGMVHVAESTFTKLTKGKYLYEECIDSPTEEIAKLFKSYNIIGKKDNKQLPRPNPLTNESPRDQPAETEEEFFESKSKLNRLTLRFSESRLERIYSSYFHSNYIRKTRLFLTIGLVLQVLFGLMDMIIDFDSLSHNWFIYFVITPAIFIMVIALSFWEQFFSKFSEIASAIPAIVLGVSTIIEILLSVDDVGNHVMIRTCLIYVYIATLFPISFLTVSITIALLFIVQIVLAIAVSSPLRTFTVSTDSIGLIMIIGLIIFSKYRMESEIRKTFVLKRRVRYKGVVITHEQKKSEQLLLNILPGPIAQRLKESSMETFIAESYKEASCMFIKVLGIEEHAKTLAANEMLGILNAIFSEFDKISSTLRLEKIKTIGTTYMVVGGVPVPREDHIYDIADMALRVRKLIAGYKNSPYPLDVQIGINIGPCVAGIIGTKKISFDLWGDAVNTASRMETNGLPGHIQITEVVAIKLKDLYLIQERGKVRVKGKGVMQTYWLTGQKSPLQTGVTYDTSKSPRVTSKPLPNGRPSSTSSTASDLEQADTVNIYGKLISEDTEVVTEEELFNYVFSN